ncbi:MAG TPA: methyltransferase domain-containing protein [Acidimicrobiia bacterium]|nr:methyltransferase domain-containing protein [Acidimicrobiia bacterium]
MSRDLMYSDEIRDLVRDTYQNLSQPDGPGLAFYDEDQVAELPPGARAWALGVGNPLRHADITEGDTALDLGCGSGIDVLLAARAVGGTGTAIGVDFLPSMIERARAFARENGTRNASFRIGDIEDLPLPDGSVDVVVSNGSINLAARKSRVLAEAIRVLRPGGRLCVTDLTLNDDDLPAEIITHPSAWAG